MLNTLYRKYRPQNFAQIIGQKHIVQTLTNAIRFNRLGQAYLFTGPRGTGKTTLARLFAKAVSCQKIGLPEPGKGEILKTALKSAEPCNACSSCQSISSGRSFDVIEIDAASHTGVDNIRELRETVKLPPVSGRYKVYIIDEAHMLSAGAFNALLKTLEEPPAHVIFILATTEIHRLPETILSRCQRFDFALLSLEQIVKKLYEIAKMEKIRIEKEALEMIAVSAEGGMRDAESLLAQIIALEDKNITAKEVENILGAARFEAVEKMADYLLEKRADEAFELVNKLINEGVNFKVFQKSLLNYLRQLMTVCVSADLAKFFKIEMTGERLKKLIEQAQNFQPSQVLNVTEILLEAQRRASSTFIPSLPLEMVIVKSCQKEADSQKQKNETASPLPAPANSSTENQKTEKSFKKKEPVQTEEEKNSRPKSPESLPDLDLIEKKWDSIVALTKNYNHSLMGFLANCQPFKIENGQLLIATCYHLYKIKLNEIANRAAVEDAIKAQTGTAVRVKFITEEEAGLEVGQLKKKQAANKKDESKEKDSSLLSEALKLMGGKIVEKKDNKAKE